MPKEREEEPKIRIVDRRMLSEAERQGHGEIDETPKPKLEMIGGGAPSPVAPATTAEDEDDEPTAEELEQFAAEIEAEQFAEIEARMGRPLTDQEKESVRVEMARQAQSASSLEVVPMLLQSMQELSIRAAVHMGLMPNPYTRLIARNDNEAKLAIDAFSGILEVIRPQVDKRMTAEFDRVLNDLRVNFVSITGKPAGKTPGPTVYGGPRIIH